MSAICGWSYLEHMNFFFSCVSPTSIEPGKKRIAWLFHAVTLDVRQPINTDTKASTAERLNV